MNSTATYSVTGITCAHCVAAVTEEFSLLVRCEPSTSSCTPVVRPG